MDDWKTIGLPFGGWAYFQGELLLVLGRVTHFMVHVKAFVASCSCSGGGIFSHFLGCENH